MDRCQEALQELPSGEAMEERPSAVTLEIQTSATVTTGLDELADAIAIIGMAGRFPGANDVESLWSMLVEEREGLRRFTRDELRAAGIPEAVLDDPDFVPVRGLVEGADRFEASLFGYSPREAATLDPQQRLFLESSWSALEAAGYDPRRYGGAIGVYGSSGLPGYLLQNLAPAGDLLAADDGYQIMISNDKDFLASRVSYKLGLRGPSMTVQTACSSSLVAVAEACLGLLGNQCDIALAGGVSLTLPLAGGYLYREGGIFSPDGRCRPFDASAQGTVTGSGVGVVVLKHLEHALRDGDHVHAVIRGFGVNNDGADKVGYTAPSIEGQAEVLSMARAMAHVRADAIGYVEAHGTATPLGDPIEVEALTRSFREESARRRFCALGSIKSNVGHLDVAAGVVGLIKAALCVERGMIPATLHFERPNPRLRLDESPFYVSDRTRRWCPDAGPRIAGVSAFGIGGTNAHVIVQEPPPRLYSRPSHRWQLLPVSAQSSAARDHQARQLVDAINERPDISIADAAFTLSQGRQRLVWRDALVVEDVPLRGPLSLSSAGYGRVRSSAPEKAPGVIFMFTGQGSQHLRMGLDLYREEPVFRAAFDDCADRLRELMGFDLRELVFSEDPERDDATELAQTSIAQPAIFAVEYALTKLWESLGVEASVMIGHSLGEYTAACLGGVFSLEAALALVVRRGQLMQSAASGAMMAVSMAEEALRGRLPEGVEIAALNTPTRSVLTGDKNALTTLAEVLGAEGVSCRSLATSHAMHSWMMEPVLEAFRAAVRAANPRPPLRPIVSSLTGRLLRAEEATDPRYWAAQLRRPVRFAEGLEACARGGASVCLEVGPGTALTSFAEEIIRGREGFVAVASMRNARSGMSDVEAWLRGVGRLWSAGVDVDLARLHGAGRRRVPLPTYPFNGPRCWIEAAPRGDTRGVSNSIRDSDPSPGAEKRSPREGTECAFFAPSWSPVAPMDRSGISGQRWVVLEDRGRLDELRRSLIGAGVEVVSLPRGSSVDLRRGLEAALSRGPLDHVVYGTSGGAEAPEEEVLRLIGVLRALASGTGLAHPLAFDVVTWGAYVLPGDTSSDPRQAVICGLLQVVAQELTDLRVRGLDLPRAEGPDGDALVGVLAMTSDDDLAQRSLVWRHGELLSRTYRPIERDATIDGDAAFRSGGVYLLTGGFGGVGLSVAHHLATKFSARLILASRSVELPPRESWPQWLSADAGGSLTRRRITEVLALEAAGAEVVAIKADVGDRSDVEGMIAEIEARFGVLDGVIHAAGVLSPCRLVDADLAHVRSVFHSKVRGTDHLLSALTRLRPGFVWLMSSLSTSLGGVGMGTYAAANAYLEATARAWGGRETRVLSVAWEGWADVGMATDTNLPPWFREAMAPFAHYWIRSEEAVRLFQRLAEHSPAGELVVTPRPLGDLFGAGLQDDRALDGHERAGTDDVLATVQRVFGEVLGIDEVGPGQDFFDLGGHSLMAIQVASRLRRRLGVVVNGHLLLEHPSAASLAEHVRRVREGAGIGEVSERVVDRSSPLVIELKKGAEGVPPLFLMHPVGGTVFQYRPLTRGLPTGVPVFGIRALGCEADEVPDEDVVVMARRYLDAARTVYRGRRWRLGGHSFGGVLAWEMAQQLCASGDEVELLALADTPGPQEVPVEFNEQRNIEIYLQEVGRGFLPELASGVCGGPGAEPPEQRMRRYFELFRRHCRAMSLYQARAYAGSKTVFFRAMSRDRFNVDRPESTWIDLSLRGMEVHLVPGNHITMSQDPEVRAQSKILAEHLGGRDEAPPQRRVG